MWSGRTDTCLQSEYRVQRALIFRNEAYNNLIATHSRCGAEVFPICYVVTQVGRKGASPERHPGKDSVPVESGGRHHKVAVLLQNRP